MNLIIESTGNSRGGINLAQNQHGIDYHSSFINVEGSALEDMYQDESARNDGSHSIEELQRIQADNLTDDEFEETSNLSGGVTQTQHA